MKTFTRSGISLAVIAALLPGMAQAEENTDVGTIDVQGVSLGGGMMVQEETPKARSTVTKEAMDKMPSAANAIDKLKYTPGLNVNSTDASGLSGVDYTMRGMNSDQIGLSADGIPINDSGNYAVYPNLLGDAENLQEIFVTQGASEADGPHIGSSGGNIGLVTRRPAKDFGGFVKQTLGSNDLSKTFARLETGDYNGFSNWLSYSHTEAKKWRGEGRLYSDKFEMNSLFEAENGNSSNLIVKYNRQENSNYNSLSKAQFERDGRDGDFPTSPEYNSRGQLSRYYKLNRNPFENLTVSFSQKLQLRDNLSWTIQPYYYWGNGGSFSSQSASTLSPASDRAGQYDLSNLSSNTYYRPSWTQTWRPGVTTKLKWDINEQHSLDLGYWYERARQLQTQPFITINPDGNPADLWGEPGGSHQVKDANGNRVQGRNQYTVTPAQKIWAQDSWYLTPDWTLVGGLAWQHVERRGENKGSLTNSPENRRASYHKFLPNVSASYRLNPENQFFYSLSRNMRTPPNYVLYNVGDSISTKPELSWNHELGWRFQREDMLLSATLFYLRYSDRQVSTTNLAGDFEMMNVGKVENRGIELEWSGQLPYHFNYYASYTWTESEQKEDVSSEGVRLPTAGKQLPNVPKNLLNLTLGYDDGLYYGGLTGKYVGAFYGDLTNDEQVGGRTLFDVAAGVHLPVDKKIVKSAALRFGIDNLFDKAYLTSARTTVFNAGAHNGLDASTPYYNVGEERTFSVSLEATF
ncbi:TonB-dependent receptor family protein [Mixta gaviniae]|uniref:TonB-dependent receptor n=1 Tax=Mixta gaviniae TaxID=665914 RepID=A0A2L0IJE2_9GAMM|nr:TonB-dependent receptor [Mixta gaviniae]AUX94701.1 TonB-dependent receptor [Mixta gaviniae]